MCSGLTCYVQEKKCTNHRHTDTEGDPSEMIEWKDYPNMVHDFMVNGVCSDITSSSDPVFFNHAWGNNCYEHINKPWVYESLYIYIYIYHNIGYHILISFVLCMSNIYYD